MSQESRGDMADTNVTSLKPPQYFSWLLLRNSEVVFEDYFESGVDIGVDFGMIGNSGIH